MKDRFVPARSTLDAWARDPEAVESSRPLLRRCGPDGAAYAFDAAWLAFTGLSAQAQLGLGWLDCVQVDDRARCESLHAEMAAQARPYTVDYRLTRHDGATRWVMDLSEPRFDAQGSFEGFDHHCVDVQERTQLTDALATRSRTMRLALRQHRRFEAALAKELEAGGSERALASLDLMVRLAGGADALDIERFRIQDCVRDAADSVRVVARSRGQTIKLELTTKSGKIACDRALLTASIACVLRDACHALPRGASLEVQASSTETAVQVELPAAPGGSACAVLAHCVGLHGGESQTVGDLGLRLTLPHSK